MGKKYIKITIGLVVLLAALMTSAVIFILQIDPNQYKAEIQNAVYEATGTQLELNQIEWNLWPNFQLDLQGLKLSTEAKMNKNLLSVDSASLKVAILPLFSNSLVIDHFILHKPSIWFFQDEAGNHNWQPLLDRVQSQDPKQESPQIENDTHFKLAINRLEISEGMIDISGAQVALVKPVNLDIQNIQFGEPIEVKFNSVIQQLDQQISLQINSKIIVDQAISRLKIPKLYLQAQGSDPEQMATIEGDADINLAQLATKANLKVRPININAWMKSLNSSYSTNSTNSTKAPTPSSTQSSPSKPSAPTPLPREALQKLQLDVALEFEDIIVKGASHSAAFAIQSKSGLIQINDFSLDAYDGQAKGSIELNAKPSPAQLKVDLDVSKMAIASILNTWVGTKPMSGEFNSAIHVTTAGNTVEELIEGIKGATDLTMANATLPKVDLHALLWKNLEQKQGDLIKTLEAFPELKKELGTLKTPKIMRDATELNQLLAQFKITPQTVTSQNITATLNEKPIKAEFIYGRKKQDLTFNTLLQLPFEHEQLANIYWPLSCKGGLSSSFSCSLDSGALKPVLKSLVKQEVKSALKEKLAPVETKAKAQLEKELGRSLKKLFNKD